jgi:hypothetical protein
VGRATALTSSGTSLMQTANSGLQASAALLYSGTLAPGFRAAHVHWYRNNPH